MNNFEIQAFILLGALLGTAGQVLRTVVSPNKNLPQIIVNLLVSCAIGTITAIALLGVPATKLTMLAFIAAGYAGTDFIEGLIKGGEK